MGYTVVKSFEKGIDTRRLRDTTEAGALLDGRDCHVTLGGELEKRAAFVVDSTMPDTTVGFYVTEGRIYHTWGDAATAPVGLPPGTIYHSIPDPLGAPLVRILSVEEFNTHLYVVAQYAPDATYPLGRIIHWYDNKPVVVPENPPVEGGGTPPVTSPGGKPAAELTLAYTNTKPESTPDITITAIYLLAPATTRNWGVDAFLIVPESAVVGGWPVCSIVDVMPTNTQSTAAAAMFAVNSFVPPVTGAAPVVVKAQANLNKVKFWIEDIGITYNGWKIEMKVKGPCRVDPGGTATFAGGIPGSSGSLREAPTPHLDPGDIDEKGYFARAFNSRMFSLQGSLLNYSVTEDATVWSGVGSTAGFIQHSMQTALAPFLTSMADFGGDLAVFGTRHVFVWHIEEGDPNGDIKKQTIHGTGTFAPHSAVPFGQSEVMYLDVSGIRSLRARSSSLEAFAADIGNLIDDLVREKIGTLTEAQKKFNVWGIVDPRSGRLWMALYDKIFVLSFYPSSRISAWTYYDATEAPIDYLVSSDNSVYWRSGNDIIIYGDEDGTVYDNTEALARIPYIDGDKPATLKNWTGIDVALFGTWSVRGSFDPTVPTALDLLANLTKSTYAQQKIAINGESPALSLELKSTYVGPARIGNAALHFSDSTAD